METSFGVFRGENVHVKIRFAPKVAGYIAEKTWHATQKLTRRKTAPCFLKPTWPEPKKSSIG
jgi:hypothetical protein